MSFIALFVSPADILWPDSLVLSEREYSSMGNVLISGLLSQSAGKGMRAVGPKA